MYTRILIMSFFIVAVSACSGNGKSKEGEQKTGKEKFDPGIDIAAITNRESLLAAARQLKAVIEREEKDKDNPEYKKKYYAILKYKGILSKRMAAITDTMPGNERADFIKQYREIFP